MTAANRTVASTEDILCFPYYYFMDELLHLWVSRMAALWLEICYHILLWQC